MQLEQFRAFSEALKNNLENDNRVLGLVFLGSAAEQGRIPDEHSDHDFFVITIKGVQEDFRQNLSWLPDAENIALAYRETAHGLKVIFKNGHLIEFAIFDEVELFLARVNDYRLVLDKSSIRQALEEIAAKSAPKFKPENEIASFISYLLIGIGRYQRGECLGGERFIKHHAVVALLALLCHYMPAENKNHLDNLDPFRRFELVFPELGFEIRTALQQDGFHAAKSLLLIAERELSSRMPDYPQESFELLHKLTA